jgi:hypothetical protein
MTSAEVNAKRKMREQKENIKPGSKAYTMESKVSKN